MHNSRSPGRHRRTAPPPRLMVPPDADRLAREAMRQACGLCACELRAGVQRLAAALEAGDTKAALCEALAMRDLAAEFRLHRLGPPLLQIERLLRAPRPGLVGASAPLAALRARLEPELAALPA